MTTDADEDGTITVANTDLPRAKSFKYLGSTIAEDGSIANDVTARIQSAWMKWRSTTGVMCDRKMSDRLKSKIYRTVIRPVAMYGTECWPATAKDEAKLAVMETTMLRWTAGVKRLDHVKNEDIRKRFGVAPIREKLRENRLRWFGHVLRADPTSIAKTSHTLEVDGKRPRGRPKRRWMDTLNEDLKETKLHPDQAADRTKWRQRSRKTDPATERDRL
ncbi:unnamed protein product [Caenorhabditis auriculariae]|uniref:Reverse transcriptase domain-containing protein n=1 Tax=Caenorhabditis auriculariae TaxID=2777116 RepID=A0A8S1HYY4_9PELO|nr:unnamed protein product [Caenorhabditis auriculariae]